jgi:hypothetical protein
MKWPPRYRSFWHGVSCHEILCDQDHISCGGFVLDFLHPNFPQGAEPMTSSPESSVTLAQKFQAFYELFTEFTQDTADLHSSLTVHDEASRAAFNSLSRILGFSDQLNLLVSLMREDIGVIDELTSDPVNANWSGEMEHCFYDWLKASRGGVANVH